MTFNTYEFILFYLPIVLIIYYIGTKRKAAKYVLLAASVFFCIFADKSSALFLFVDIAFNYGIYRMMMCCRRERVTGFRCILWGGVACNIAILLWFKYYNFFVDNLNLVFDTGFSIKEIFLPIGISYITFQQIAFLVDAGRQEIPVCSLPDYALFISYFPHIWSGPIIRHSDFLPLLKIKEKKDWDRFAQGIFMFVMGLGKKVLIADIFGNAVNQGYTDPSALNATTALFVSLAYSMQIYFDFSGYSDMAIGISRMLQLDLPVNFDSPYKADTILEFWKRWHMTLTQFLTRYLYIPLGGSRKGRVRTYINTMIVFLCSGLWHGASWTFILWGGLHGCFMVLTKCFQSVFDRLPKAVNRCITLLFINFTWIIFRAGSFTVLKQMLRALLSNEWGALAEEVSACFMPFVFEALQCPNQVYAVLYMIAAIVIVLKCKNVQEKAENMTYSVKSCVMTLGVALLSILSLSHVSTFVYSLF